MKKTLFLLAILILVAASFACGGKTEKTENEKKQVPAASNTALNNSANQPVLTQKNDGDADDVRPANSNISNSQIKTDADDLKKTNANQKMSDRDDVRGKRDADDRNRSNNSRRDADDYGKRDNDGDADDN